MRLRVDQVQEAKEEVVENLQLLLEHKLGKVMTRQGHL